MITKNCLSLKRLFCGYWYWFLVFLILIGELIVFLIAGEQYTYLGIHDNLDIHIADYQILRNNNAFFSDDVTIPLLGGINRDFLLSEYYLYSLLYAVFPNFTAYIIGYFLKIIIALTGGCLLGRDILGDDYRANEWIVVVMSLIYGLLPLYPAFAFSFTSIPLMIYFVRRLENTGQKRWYICVFFYPVLSYFTFFGIFVVAYLFLWFLYRSLSQKKVAVRLLTADVLLSLGYILLEYRLFRLIFMSGEKTIRETMVFVNRSAGELCELFIDGFVNNIFHCEDLHKYFVLPVVLIYLVVLNVTYIKNRKYADIIKDNFNRLFILILFNCFIYIMQECRPVRELIFTVISPLDGWQFNRTIFFNPFIWYTELAIVIYRCFNGRRRKLSYVMAAVALFVVIGKQSLYNDFYNTVYVNAYRIVKGIPSETLSYGEFFSKYLFETIKEDIDYDGEYSVAYGFHPSVLSYNGISTLDGCLSHYFQSYKEEFRKVIEPALEESEVARTYYDEWGGRAYLFSGTVENIWSPERTKDTDDHRLLIDPEAFRDLGGKYVFSRIEIDNTEELGINLVGSYSDDKSPYTIFVYKNE
ncbi:MAG: DUF6044 family protein [Lachnospiraceae bacterium]|nr:DUF6044 family protein [Lachnospiraceae bacterium]